MICISIGNINLIREVNSLQPSLVEIRYDMMRREPEEVKELLGDTILQVATCRPGHYRDSQRSDILIRAIAAGAVYVDVEIESSRDFIGEIARAAKTRRTHLIISYHNFNETPQREELLKILSGCYESGADIAKISCTVNSRSDAARLLSLYEEPGRKIVVGMGDSGKITRLAAIELGAEFTFAALSEDTATAPGQLTFLELTDLHKKLHNR
jgi:3-dehydroquinate dehydratase I